MKFGMFPHPILGTKLTIDSFLSLLCCF
jgi:hypothetical protein